MTPRAEELAQRIAGRHTFTSVVRAVALGERVILKNAVGAASIGDEEWAGALAGLEGTRVFLELLAKAMLPTAIGAVPGAFHAHIPRQLTRFGGFWVGEAGPKPATKATFSRVVLRPLTAATLTVLTDDLLRASNPATDAAIQRQLRSSLAARANTSFLDPSNAGIADIRPASITNSATSVPATGDLRADIEALIAAADADDVELGESVLIMRPAKAARAAGAFGTDRCGVRGGELVGLPVYAANEAGDQVVLVDASRIVVAQEGINVRESGATAVQMRDDPVSGPTTLVSLWQTNSRGVRVETALNWSAAEGAVYILTEGS